MLKFAKIVLICCFSTKNVVWERKILQVLKFAICLRINKIMLSHAPVPSVYKFMYWFMIIFKGMGPSKK